MQSAVPVAGQRVFIGHGRSAAWRELKDFVDDRLHLPWDEFNRVPAAGVTNVARLSGIVGCGWTPTSFQATRGLQVSPVRVPSARALQERADPRLVPVLQIESLGSSILLVAHRLWGQPIADAASHGSDNLVGTSAHALAREQSVLQVLALVLVWIAFARADYGSRCPLVRLCPHRRVRGVLATADALVRPLRLLYKRQAPDRG